VGALVSGRAFLGPIRHVRDRHGAAELRRLIELAGPAAQRVLAERVSKLGWYPYEAFAQFLDAAERTLPKSSRGVSFELGSVAGKQDLGTVLKIYVALSSPERLIKSCKLVWPSYYRNAGRMEAVEWQPESTLLRIYDFPKMDRLHCRLMVGWMIATMESLGFLVNGDARQTQFMGDGAPYHEFHCSWQRRR
jgi:hypothetical protein